LRRNLDRCRIAAKLPCPTLDQCDALFHLVKRPPATEPALPILRHALERLEVVAANIEGERLRKALGRQLQILVAVIFPGEAAALLVEELVQNLQALIHHVAATRTLDPLSAPGCEFLAVCPKA